MRAAWLTLVHRFAVRRPIDACSIKDEDVFQKIGPRYPPNLLIKKPVDLLVIERGQVRLPPSTLDCTPWGALISGTPIPKRPRVIIESWNTGAHMWERGPTSKSCQTRWSKLGYVSRFRRVDACHVGGAIAQVRLIVARVMEDYGAVWVWGHYPPPPYTPRPMGNLLTPPGLLPQKIYCDLPFDSPRVDLDPMPCFPGAWVKTDQGHRRLLLEETARGLGVPKGWNLDQSKLTGGTLLRTTSLYHWEFLSSSFVPSLAPPLRDASPHPVVDLKDTTYPTTPPHTPFTL